MFTECFKRSSADKEYFLLYTPEHGPFQMFAGLLRKEQFYVLRLYRYILNDLIVDIYVIHGIKCSNSTLHIIQFTLDRPHDGILLIGNTLEVPRGLCCYQNAASIINICASPDTIGGPS
jgi:hypothetical protein